MDGVQQREKYTTTLSKETKDRLEDIRKRQGLSSGSMVIEFLVMEHEQNRRIDRLIELYEGTHTYIESIAEAIKKKASQVATEKNEETVKQNTYGGSTAGEYQEQDGWCEGHFEKGVSYKLKWVKRTTPDGMYSEDKWLCPKCIAKAKENDNKIEPAL